MTASAALDHPIAALPVPRAGDETRAGLEALYALTGKVGAGDAPILRIAFRLIGADGTFRGILLHGTVGAVRATALAVEELARCSRTRPVDLTDPDLVAIVGQPRYWILTESPDGDWHGEPAAYGRATPNAILGTRVTFETN